MLPARWLAFCGVAAALVTGCASATEEGTSPPPDVTVSFSPAQPTAPSTGGPPAPATGLVTEDDRTLIDDLKWFASAPDQLGLDRLPFAPMVALGLADQLLFEVDRADLIDPAVWRIDVDDLPFRGRSGVYSVLDLLREGRPLEVTVGPHPHCASPAIPAPAGFEDARRVAAQPTDATSCIEWFTVDLFIQDGLITAVTLDLYEP